MPDKKKLFLIINRLSHAGGSTDALSMAFYLTKNYEVTIIYGEKEKDEKDTPFVLHNQPIRFIKINSLRRSILPFNDIVSFKNIAKLIKNDKPDIVHTHGFKPGLLGRLAAKFAHVPAIVHTYHGHVFHSYYSKTISSFICLIERKLASLSDKIIAISPQQAYELSFVYKIAPAEKISTVFIGVDEKNYTIKQDLEIDLRRDYKLAQSTVTIAIIGRIVPIKNHSFFVRIAEKILQQNKDVRFFIIGDGNRKSAIQNELAQLQIEWSESIQSNNTKVYFTHWITDIASVLKDIDIVVSTSLNEGTPVSLIEAQLFGKTVVATNVGGVRDTVIHNETGFLVDDFNLDDFVNKLQLLIDDKTLRDKMGKQGKAFVTERFSKQNEVIAIDKLYFDILQNKNS